MVYKKRILVFLDLVFIVKKFYVMIWLMLFPKMKIGSAPKPIVFSLKNSY